MDTGRQDGPSQGAGISADDLVDVMMAAGAAVMQVYGDEISVSAKKDASPVTEADERAEAIILEGLARIAPDIPVIAEEAASAGRIPEVGDRFFLVDPLDGTREFISRNGEFTVNIALVDDGVPVLGAVYAPALGTMALGDVAGAREARVDATGRLGMWSPMTARAVPERGPVAVASRSHRDAETDAFLALIGAGEIRSAGSSLKFCLLARGEADVYPRFGRTMEWDTAAGHAVLRAAGGSVCTRDGAPLSYCKRERGYDNPAFIAWGRRDRPASDGPPLTM